MGVYLTWPYPLAQAKETDGVQFIVGMFERSLESLEPLVKTGLPFLWVDFDRSILGGVGADYSHSMSDDKATTYLNGGGVYQSAVFRSDRPTLCYVPNCQGWSGMFYKAWTWCTGYRKGLVYSVIQFHADDVIVASYHPIATYNALYAPPTNYIPDEGRLITSYQCKGKKINCQAIAGVNGNNPLLYVSAPHTTGHVELRWNTFTQLTTDNDLFNSLSRNTPEDQGKEMSPVDVQRRGGIVLLEGATMDTAKYMITCLFPYKDLIHHRVFVGAKGPGLWEAAAMTAMIDDEDDDGPPDLDKKVETEFVELQKGSKKKRDELGKKFIKDHEHMMDDFTNALPTPTYPDTTGVQATMDQVSPLPIKRPITAPGKFQSLGTMDAVEGRLMSTNKDRKTLLKDCKAILKTVDNIIPLIFDVEFAIDNEDLESHLSGPVLKRWQEVQKNEIGASAANDIGKRKQNFTKVELQTGGCRDKAYRNITNDCDPSVVIMKQFTTVLAKQMSKFRGYAFGKTTRQNGDYIHFLARRTKTCTETDYSGFDGTQNSFCFVTEKKIYAHVFKKATLIMLAKFFAVLCNVSSGEFSYNTLFSRLSGASDTSVMNTNLNIIFTLLSRLYEGKSYDQVLKPTKEEVHRLMDLSIAGGDDGIAYDIDPEHYMKFTKFVGLDLKAECKPSSAPVSFLARKYPSPSTTPASGLDIERMFLKMTHAVKSMNFNRAEQLFLKLQGYTISDSQTPKVGRFLNAYKRYLLKYLTDRKLNGKINLGDISWSTKLGQGYPIEGPEATDAYLATHDPEVIEKLDEMTERLENNTFTDLVTYKNADVNEYVFNNTELTTVAKVEGKCDKNIRKILGLREEIPLAAVADPSAVPILTKAFDAEWVVCEAATPMATGLFPLLSKDFNLVSTGNFTPGVEVSGIKANEENRADVTIYNCLGKTCTGGLKSLEGEDRVVVIMDDKERVLKGTKRRFVVKINREQFLVFNFKPPGIRGFVNRRTLDKIVLLPYNIPPTMEEVEQIEKEIELEQQEASK